MKKQIRLHCVDMNLDFLEDKILDVHHMPEQDEEFELELGYGPEIPDELQGATLHSTVCTVVERLSFSFGGTVGPVTLYLTDSSLFDKEPHECPECKAEEELVNAAGKTAAEEGTQAHVDAEEDLGGSMGSMVFEMNEDDANCTEAAAQVEEDERTDRERCDDEAEASELEYLEEKERAEFEEEAENEARIAEIDAEINEKIIEDMNAQEAIALEATRNEKDSH